PVRRAARPGPPAARHSVRPTGCGGIDGGVVPPASTLRGHGAERPREGRCGTAPSGPRTERQPMTPSDPGPGFSGADTTLVRRWNRRTVLATLRAHPEVTLSAMAKLTGLSRQTLTAVLEELTTRGLVEAHAPATGGS